MPSIQRALRSRPAGGVAAGAGFFGLSSTIEGRRCHAPWRGVMRSITGRERQAASSTSATRAIAAIFLRQGSAGARWSRCGGDFVEQHILDAFAQRRGNVLIQRELAGIDDAHIHPASWMAWNRNTECIASRTFSLPRKEKEKLEDATRNMGMRGLSRRMIFGRLDEGLAISLCSSRPVATAKMLGSKMMSFGREEGRPLSIRMS